jgi:hypothetical protein
VIDPLNQPNLFSPPTELSAIDRDLSRLGLTRREITTWHSEGFLSFDPTRVQALERWMFDEVVFIRDLRKVEWSLNALRQILAPLKRPYAYSHAEFFFNFREMKWQRYFPPFNMKAWLMAEPDEVVRGACGLVRGLRDFGTRGHVLTVLGEVQRALGDDQSRRDVELPPHT